MQDTYPLSGIRSDVATVVRVELAKRRMSAAELARRAGMKQQRLARRMTGNTAFDVDDLAAIAKVLDIPMAALLPVERAA